MTCSNALTEIIRQEIITHEGVIPFDLFMELALYHPEWGYYCSPQFTIGKTGDFVTAPELTPLFAKCIATQCLEVFEKINAASILELGAGSGRLAVDILSYLQEQNSLPEHYYIYEISEALRTKQKKLIEVHYPQFFKMITWIDTLPFEFTGIIIANEVLDALPCHLFQLSQDSIKEKGVEWVDNEFKFKLFSPKNPDFLEKVSALKIEYNLDEGYESEMNLNLIPFLSTLCETIDEGLILFLDYGYGRKEYYHPKRDQGTLTCFFQHQRHHNPLIHVGKQDITAHVDFTHVIEIAHAKGCTLEGFTSLSAFLLSLGLMDLMTQEEPLDPIAKLKLHNAIKTLTLPTEMGETIKVMALGKNFSTPLKGFTLQDKRREL